MGKKSNTRSARKNAPSIPTTASPKITCVERTLSTAQLTSGLPYQRNVEERDVNRLMREWDDKLFDPLVVSYREGKFNIVDGQNRASVLRKRNGGTLWCAARFTAA